MTTGEWSCLISFTWAPLTCSKRRGSEKFQNKNICLQRDSNQHHTSPRQESQCLRPLGHEGLMMISSLMSYRIMGYKLIKPLRDNTCQIDYGYMCIRTECQTKLSFLISMQILASIVFVYRILNWVSNHNRFHTGIVTYPFVFIYQNTDRLFIPHLISNQRGRAVESADFPVVDWRSVGSNTAGNIQFHFGFFAPSTFRTCQRSPCK